jgi:hypothetical protein
LQRQLTVFGAYDFAGAKGAARQQATGQVAKQGKKDRDYSGKQEEAKTKQERGTRQRKTIVSTGK